MPPLSTQLKTSTLADEPRSIAGVAGVVSMSNEFQVRERGAYTMKMNLPGVAQTRMALAEFLLLAPEVTNEKS